MPNYTSYNKSGHGFDVAGAVKVTALDLEYDQDDTEGELIMVQRSDGEWKAYDKEYIDEAIEACELVDDYENTTRYHFWNVLKTKAADLNVKKLKKRKKKVKNGRRKAIDHKKPGFVDEFSKVDRDALAGQ